MREFVAVSVESKWWWIYWGKLCGSLAIGEGGEGFSDTELRGDKAVISSYFD
jgi:hypothetical protein